MGVVRLYSGNNSPANHWHAADKIKLRDKGGNFVWFNLFGPGGGMEFL
jgi:hypothetical protein